MPRRTVLSILLALLLVVALGACASTETATESADQPATTQSAATAAAPANNAAVVGTWNLELTYEGQLQKITLEIREEGGKLAGTWVGPHRTNPLVDFTWDGTTLTFVRNVNREGTPVALKHKATVSGNDMKGTITQPEGEVPFTAKRAAA
jgi:hypothetical protein